MWIEELQNGKYKVRERYADPMTGKQKIVSVTIEKNTRQSQRTAQEMLQEKIAKACHVTSCDTITLSELVEAYRADQKKTVRESTYKRNWFSIEALKKILGENILVSNLSAPYVREKLIGTGKEAGTLNEHLKRFKAMIRWGYRNDLVKDISYLEKLPNFKVPPHRESIKDKYLEADELKLLINGMKQPIWKLLTRFLALSGLRIGEAIALTVKDIDFDKQEIHITKAYDSVNEILSYPKNSSSIRDIGMQPELEAVCREILIEMKRFKLRNAVPKTNLFFFGVDGKYIDYYAYNKYLREQCIRIIGRPLTPHGLRHTHASLLMEQGVPIDVISRRLGHENSKITREIYLHVTRKLREKDKELLSAVSLF